MFTFGRDHEVRCAVEHVGDAARAELLVQVVHRVHDLLDGVDGAEARLVEALEEALAQGPSGVWESAASWARKVAERCPEVGGVWSRLAEAKDWRTRWRVACCLGDVAIDVRERVGSLLTNDASAKVRETTSERLRELRDGPG